MLQGFNTIRNLKTFFVLYITVKLYVSFAKNITINFVPMRVLSLGHNYVVQPRVKTAKKIVRSSFP